MKQKLIELKVEIDKSTVIIGVFNTLLSAIDRTRTESYPVYKRTEHHQPTGSN